MTASSGPHVFLVGPGGVGKSSIGWHLAGLLERPFVDIDRLFIDNFGDIGEYIQLNGYVAYAERNARVFANSLGRQLQQTVPAVFALSSGQLAANQHVDCITSSRALVRQHGVAVLPLPDEDLGLSMRIVVGRQLERGFGLNVVREREKFHARIATCMALADIVFYSQQSPADIAADLAVRLFSESRVAADSQ